MWIVSKFGLFNTDKIAIFSCIDSQTVAIADGQKFVVSDKPVVGDIIEALESHKEFLEV